MMTFNGQAILNDLKANAVPIIEKDLVGIVDSVLNSIIAQAAAQPTDLSANLIGMALGAIKPALDAELAKLIAPAPAS